MIKTRKDNMMNYLFIIGVIWIPLLFQGCTLDFSNLLKPFSFLSENEPEIISIERPEEQKEIVFDPPVALVEPVAPNAPFMSDTISIFEIEKLFTIPKNLTPVIEPPQHDMQSKVFFIPSMDFENQWGMSNQNIDIIKKLLKDGNVTISDNIALPSRKSFMNNNSGFTITIEEQFEVKKTKTYRLLLGDQPLANFQLAQNMPTRSNLQKAQLLLDKQIQFFKNQPVVNTINDSSDPIQLVQYNPNNTISDSDFEDAFNELIVSPDDKEKTSQSQQDQSNSGHESLNDWMTSSPETKDSHGDNFDQFTDHNDLSPLSEPVNGIVEMPVEELMRPKIQIIDEVPDTIIDETTDYLHTGHNKNDDIHESNPNNSDISIIKNDLNAISQPNNEQGVEVSIQSDSSEKYESPQVYDEELNIIVEAEAIEEIKPATTVPEAAPIQITEKSANDNMKATGNEDIIEAVILKDSKSEVPEKGTIQVIEDAPEEVIEQLIEDIVVETKPEIPIVNQIVNTTPEDTESENPTENLEPAQVVKETLEKAIEQEVIEKVVEAEPFEDQNQKAPVQESEPVQVVEQTPEETIEQEVVELIVEEEPTEDIKPETPVQKPDEPNPIQVVEETPEEQIEQAVDEQFGATETAEDIKQEAPIQQPEHVQVVEETPGNMIDQAVDEQIVETEPVDQISPDIPVTEPDPGQVVEETPEEMIEQAIVEEIVEAEPVEHIKPTPPVQEPKSLQVVEETPEEGIEQAIDEQMVETKSDQNIKPDVQPETVQGVKETPEDVIEQAVDKQMVEIEYSEDMKPEDAMDESIQVVEETPDDAIEEILENEIADTPADENKIEHPIEESKSIEVVEDESDESLENIVEEVVNTSNESQPKTKIDDASESTQDTIHPDEQMNMIQDIVDNPIPQEHIPTTDEPKNGDVQSHEVKNDVVKSSEQSNEPSPSSITEKNNVEIERILASLHQPELLSEQTVKDYIYNVNRPNFKSSNQQNNAESFVDLVDYSVFFSQESISNNDIPEETSAGNARFIDHGNGTITDTMTGLMWFKNTNCIASEYPDFDQDMTQGDGKISWQKAIEFINALNQGNYPKCSAGFSNWRLPRVKEMYELVDLRYTQPVFQPDHPFIINNTNSFWTMSGNPKYSQNAWVLFINDGHVDLKTNSDCHTVWWMRDIK